MAIEGRCIVCLKPTDTGLRFVHGSPELMAAALMMIGVPRAYAERRAADLPNDPRVILCRSCSDLSGNFFPPSETFPTYRLRE